MSLYRLVLQSLALTLITSLLLVSSQPVLAGVKGAGELTPSGTVMINNAAVTSNVTLLSNSRIATMAGSSAVANLGSAGQVLIGENTDMMLSFEQTWVKIELYNGSVRVQSGPQSVATVTTRTCGRVEVTSGTVMVTDISGKKKDEVKGGESKEFMNKQGFASNSMSSPTDYRVVTNNCQVGAAPVASGISRRTLLILLGAGGGAAAAAGGIAAGGGGSSNTTPPPAGGGTPSSPNNP
jgi:hypothetical protein